MHPYVIVEDTYTAGLSKASMCFIEDHRGMNLSCTQGWQEILHVSTLAWGSEEKYVSPEHLNCKLVLVQVCGLNSFLLSAWS